MGRGDGTQAWAESSISTCPTPFAGRFVDAMASSSSPGNVWATHPEPPAGRYSLDSLIRDLRFRYDRIGSIVDRSIVVSRTAKPTGGKSKATHKPVQLLVVVRITFLSATCFLQFFICVCRSAARPRTSAGQCEHAKLMQTTLKLRANVKRLPCNTARTTPLPKSGCESRSRPLEQRCTRSRKLFGDKQLQ